MRLRSLVAVGACLGVLGLFVGCLFVRSPTPVGPVFQVGEVVGAVGELVEIPVQVGGFAEPGVAGVAVLALRYNPSALEIQEIVGQSGFRVLCFCINQANSLLKFLAVNPNEGLRDGSLVLLRGRRLSLGDPGFALSSQDLQLLDGANLPIAPGTFAVRLGGSALYYVRRGR